MFGVMSNDPSCGRASSERVHGHALGVGSVFEQELDDVGMAVIRGEHDQGVATLRDR